MKTGSKLAFFVVLCIPLMMFACSDASPTAVSPNSTTQNPIVDTSDPSTSAVVPVLPTPTATVAAASQLSESQMLEIVRSSLAEYPWRMEQSVLVAATGQTITSLTEVQSSTRGYNRSDQPLGSETVTIESILIDQSLYLKITGSPAETYGLVSGQWMEITADSPLAQLVDTSAVDPAKIAEIFATDFAAISGESGVDEMLFQAAGSEDVNGIPTTIYEAKGETFTYRWWIGDDGRFYKSTVERAEATRTIVIEYDPTINVEAPSP